MEHILILTATGFIEGLIAFVLALILYTNFRGDKK